MTNIKKTTMYLIFIFAAYALLLCTFDFMQPINYAKYWSIFGKTANILLSGFLEIFIRAI